MYKEKFLPSSVTGGAFALLFLSLLASNQPVTAQEVHDDLVRCGVQDGSLAYESDDDHSIIDIECPISVDSLMIDVSYYIAPDTPSAVDLARSLNFLIGNEYEHPSNMCGPLAASILVEAGLLPPDTDISQYWLATPDRLKNLLPGFVRITDGTIPLGSMDFSETQELQVGDFLYLWGGHYDHMLTVTQRKDFDNGYQVYGITNMPIKNGYIVDHVLLYDSRSDGSDTLFDDYTRPHSIVGQVGLGGVYIYRPATHIQGQ